MSSKPGRSATSGVSGVSSGTPSTVSKNSKNKRLDYIAQLAGYTPGKPIIGKKTTTVTEHDFNKGFHSEEVAKENTPSSSSSPPKEPQ